MKRFTPYILIFLLPFLTARQVAAQCEPDTSCLDPDSTDTFCPRNLPNAIVGEPYETILTVIPPSEFVFEGVRLDIAYIEIDSVRNFPPGITYSVSEEKFYADSAYCVLISGTPEQAGEFALRLYVTPYIRYPLFGVLKGPQAIDNTSVVLTVNDVTGTDLPDTKPFQVLQNVPNPFYQSTRIGFYTPVNDNVNLKIFNLLGELVYEESRLAAPGEQFFRFNGSELLAGTYLYRVTSGSSYITRKLVKTL